ncbi:MAG: hypothetical protein ACREN8_11670 [Candidatus Dormibacteraceae bacterium]
MTLDFSHSLTPDQRDRGLQAFIRTYAILNWAIENNELAFLQSDCVSLPMGQAEADDIEGVKKAEALHGHVIDDPPAHFITIGVEAVPANISDTVLRRLGVRPNIAVITVTEGAEIWVGDTKGHHIKQLAKTDPGERVFTITLGQIKDDGIGLRIWQTGVYGCLNTEVAGLCDGVV